MAQREKLMKMLFDTYEFAAMYVANTSTLAMYASGTSSTLRFVSPVEQRITIDLSLQQTESTLFTTIVFTCSVEPL